MASRPYDHIDTVISGIIDSADQGWSCGFTNAAVDHSSLPGGLAVGDLVDICDAIRAAIVGPGPLLSIMGSDVTITAIRAYARLAGNPDATLVGENVSPMGGAGTPDVPTQIAAVATLLTGAAGRANRGRVYWPIAGCTGRRLTSGQNTTIAQETVDIISAQRTSVSSAWGTDAGPVVGNNGLLVTRVRVDDVPDTQRRRRNKVSPTSVVGIDVPVP